MSIFPAEGPLQQYSDPPKEPFQVHSYPKLALHDGTLHLIHDDGYRILNAEKTGWDIVEVPFTTCAGMVITSTPKGLVVSGGEQDGVASSDLWVCLQGKWRPISASISPRAHHACAWAPTKNALLVHGGFNEKMLGDLELVDLDSGTVTEIPLDQRIELTNHTITVIDNSKVVIFGGLDGGKHLNDQMFEIDINTGHVTIISGDHGLAVRCSHLAFEYFGCLCVTGGFRMGERVQSACLFDFTTGVWLTIPLDDQVFRDAWFALSLPIGFWILSNNFGEGKIVYYNQNKQPFVDVNDEQLVLFLGRVMELNSVSNVLRKVEKVNIDLLVQVEEARRKLVELVTKTQPEIRALDVAEKISERDQLAQKLIKMDIFSAKQAKRRSERTGNPLHLELPREVTPPMTILREIEALKKEKKDQITTLSERCAHVFSEMQARIKLGAAVERLSPYHEDLRAAELALVAPEIDQQIRLNKANIEELDKEIEELQTHNLSIEESWIDAATHLQQLKEEAHKLEHELCEHRRRYFEKQKEFISANYQVVKSLPLARGRTDVDEFNEIQTKIEVYIEEMAKYKIRVPENLNKLINRLKILLDMSPDTEPEKIKRMAAEVLHILTGLVEMHNKGAELCEDKSEALTLVATPDAWRSEIERSNARARTETVSPMLSPMLESRGVPGNFTRKTFDLANSTWCAFYNQIVGLMEQVNEQEKSTGV